MHTLSPILVRGDEVRALATPGADGQVQSLLQVLTAHAARRLGAGHGGAAVAERVGQAADRAVASRPGDAAGLGHAIEVRDDGDGTFGSMTSAGITGGRPFALSDWRRSTSSGVV